MDFGLDKIKALWLLAGIVDHDASVLIDGNDHDIFTLWHAKVAREKILYPPLDDIETVKDTFFKATKKTPVSILLEFNSWPVARTDCYIVEPQGPLVMFSNLTEGEFDEFMIAPISQKYFARMQHNLLVSENTAGSFVGYNKTKNQINIINVLADEIFIEKLLSLEIKFWRSVIKGRLDLGRGYNEKSIRGVYENFFEDFKENSL